jgi:hypothetical protein
MTKHMLLHLGDPEVNNDAVTLKYVKPYLKHDGSS